MSLLAVTLTAAAALGVVAAGAAVLGLTVAALLFAGLSGWVLGSGIAVNWLLWAFRGRAAHDALALAVICDPCHGRPGLCTCTSKAACGYGLCGAPDTITDGEFSRQVREMLDGEGGQR